MDWAEPKNIGDWLARLLSLRPIMVLLIIFGIFISELRFDWMEQMLGAFLARTNALRPESGAIWEINRQTETARRTLDRIVTDRQASQREARNAASFVEISAALSADQGVMLAPEDFRRLYLGLSPSIAQELISPYEVLKICSQARFTRTYLEKQANGLQVYFLDSENRVLQRLQIASNLLELISESEHTVEDTLDSFAKYKHRIYPAEQFLDALGSLPDDIRRNVMPQPERLLSVPGRMVRVGISDETVSGNIEVAFEFRSGSVTQVIFVPGREWAVWQIRSKLEEKHVDAASFVERGP